MKQDQNAILKALGTRLRAYRETRGLSQEEVSFGAGIHRTYLSQIELGERNPSFLVLVQICDTLSLNVSDFIQEVMAASSR